MDIDDLKIPFTNYVDTTYAHSIPPARCYNNDRNKEINNNTWEQSKNCIKIMVFFTDY